MLSILVHLYNVFFMHVVQVVGDSIQVLERTSGKLLIFVGKNAHGQYVDMGEMYGAKMRLDMSPIPRDARVFKLGNAGVIKDDQSEDRKKMREAFVKDGFVQSIAALKKQEWDFDDKGRVITRPVVEAVLDGSAAE